MEVMDRVPHMGGMDLGQRKKAVVHYLSMGKFVNEENFNFPVERSFLQPTMATHTNKLALNSCSS